MKIFKKQTIIFIIIFIMLAGINTNAMADDAGYESGIYAFNVNGQGSINFNNMGFNAHSNFKDNGNINSKTVCGINGLIPLGKKIKIKMDALEYTLSGNLDIYGNNAAPVINGQLLGNNFKTVTAAELKTNYADLHMVYNIKNEQMYDLNIIFGYSLVRYELNLTPVLNNNLKVNYLRKLYIPVIGGNASYNLSKNSIAFLSGNFGITNSSSRDYELSDFEIGLKYKLNSSNQCKEWINDCFLNISYRQKHFKEKDNNNELVINNNGPKFTIGIKYWLTKNYISLFGINNSTRNFKIQISKNSNFFFEII